MTKINWIPTQSIKPLLSWPISYYLDYVYSWHHLDSNLSAKYGHAQFCLWSFEQMSAGFYQRSAVSFVPGDDGISENRANWSLANTNLISVITLPATTQLPPPFR